VGRSTPVLDHFLRLFRRLGATVTITFDGPDSTFDGHDGTA
jgi:hypothetical protein